MKRLPCGFRPSSASAVLTAVTVTNCYHVLAIAPEAGSTLGVLPYGLVD